MPELLLSDYDAFCNLQGSIRVNLVRKYFGLICPNCKESKNNGHECEHHHLEQTVSLTEYRINEIKDLFIEWRNTVELMPLRLNYEDIIIQDFNNTPVDANKWINEFNILTGRIATKLTDNPSCNIVCYEGHSSEWVLKEAVKRGNAPYIKLLKKKFKPLKDCKKTFFSTAINSKRKRVKKTRLLYITGTTARKYCSSCGSALAVNTQMCESCGSMVFSHLNIADAWLKFGKDFNSFIINIREQFDGCEFLRTWQSQEDGYPHFHALIYFPSFEFTAFKNREFNPRKNKYVYIWRVHNKQKLKGRLVRDRIKDAWKHGFLDIKCCDSVKDAFTDLLKYVIRDLEGGESNLTNAMVWYFGKQSFAISDRFFEMLGVNKTSLEPSDDDLINAEGVINSNNSKKKLISIEVFPLVRDDLVPKISLITLDNFENPPEPPPFDEKFLDYYAFNCVPSSSRKVYLDDGSSYDVIVYKRK